MGLVISRKQGEGITVDGPCRFKITKIRSNKAVLVFYDADGTTILRSELQPLPKEVAAAAQPAQD